MPYISPDELYMYPVSFDKENRGSNGNLHCERESDCRPVLRVHVERSSF